MPTTRQVRVAAEELANHVAGMGALPQSKGTAAQRGGLRCSCGGWSKNQNPQTKIRPWGAFHQHVAAAVLMAVEQS